MNQSNCVYNFSCCALALVASIIIGIVTVFLTYSATIAISPVFLWVFFGIALLFLFTEYFAFRSNNTACICGLSTQLLVGILGTVLTTLVLLTIDFAATSIIGAIVTGLMLFFFTLTLFTVACKIRCKCRNLG